MSNTNAIIAELDRLEKLGNTPDLQGWDWGEEREVRAGLKGLIAALQAVLACWRYDDVPPYPSEQHGHNAALDEVAIIIARALGVSDGIEV